MGLRLAGLVLGWSLILGWRLVNWFGLVPGLRLAWFRWFGLGSWLELDLPDQRPSHVVAPPPEPGSWSRACGASKDFCQKPPEPQIRFEETGAEAQRLCWEPKLKKLYALFVQ